MPRRGSPNAVWVLQWVGCGYCEQMVMEDNDVNTGRWDCGREYG